MNKLEELILELLKEAPEDGISDENYQHLLVEQNIKDIYIKDISYKYKMTLIFDKLNENPNQCTKDDFINSIQNLKKENKIIDNYNHHIIGLTHTNLDYDYLSYVYIALNYSAIIENILYGEFTNYSEIIFSDLYKFIKLQYKKIQEHYVFTIIENNLSDKFEILRAQFFRDSIIKIKG